MSEEIERLIQGRKRKFEMTKYFGFIPLSILRIKTVNLGKFYNYQNETNTSSTSNWEESKDKYEYIEGSWSGKGIGRGKKTFSIMPGKLVDFFIKFYAKKGDLYFDPFAGQGVQLQVANLHGINYIGYDICKEYVNFINEFIPKLEKKSNILEIHYADSKKIELPDNSVDFCFTSPPYWDIEIYDENPEQLGINKTYPEFLEGMKQVGKELLRIFKKGGVV